MKASVRQIYSPDTDLERGYPEDPKNFAILVSAMVGPKDDIGEESFDIVYCTPSWVGRWIEENGPLDARHHFIVNEWNPVELKSLLTQLIEAEEASTWGELATRISRIGFWEFEDYNRQ